ncbi:Protoglobin-domain-containing protein, partial [Gaertneriomyces semiglobifer]
RLYTDVQYRFQYVASFANFGEEDIKYIKASAPIVAPLVPAIVDAVYDQLFQFDITKAHFLPRMAGFEGKVEGDLDHLNVGSEAIKFRKGFLSNYLKKLVTGSYDENFVKYLDWVGKIHIDTPDKKSKINVEYIHCNALFAWLHGFLAETLDAHPDLQADPVARSKTLAAFSKLLWIQNDLFAKYY